MEERKLFSIASDNRFSLDAEFVRQFVGKQPKWGPVGRVTYLRTYSRPLTDAQMNYAFDKFGILVKGSEEFWQTTQRVVEGVWSIFKQTVRSAFNPWNEAEAQEKAQEMFRRMWDFKFLPPGRGMWFMGTEALELKGSAALNNCGFVSTANIDQHFAHPFVVLMDFLMLGVGMGFDTRGAGKITLVTPEVDSKWIFTVPDTREGWVLALDTLLSAFVGAGKMPLAFDYSRIRPEGAPLKTFGGTASGAQPLIDMIEGIRAILMRRVGQAITKTDIVDIKNMIGKCVVAGNVRRSSEIAIDEDGDDEFLGLKDPSALNASFARQGELARKTPGWSVLEQDVAEHMELQSRLSVLSPEFMALQDGVDGIKKAQKDLLIANPEWAAEQAKIDAHPLFTHRWASNNTVLCKAGQDFTRLADMTVRNGEPGYGFLETIRTRGRLIDPPDDKDQFVMGFNPCAEQPLEDNELCCLVETFPTNHDSLEDFLITLKYAFMYAKCVTLIPTHRPETNAVMTRNRRIGTSMAGVWEMYELLGLPECIRWWDAGFKEIKRWDKTYSHWLGINESSRHTTVKPGGTIPLLAGKEGGMKLPSSECYLRTIRMDHLHPLVAACREAGYRVEPDRTTPRTMVVYFPVRDPAVASGKVRTAREVTIWEQVAVLVALQTYWSDNMVSNTITFRRHEAQDVAKVLSMYSDRLKTISFLPLSDHGYLQAPYIPCTLDEFNAATAKLKPLEVDGIIAHDTDEKYCSGGLCEAPAR